MQFYEIDSLFVMASQGDQKAYETLLNFFVENATKIIQNELRNHKIRFKAEEFQDFIYENFIEMLTNFSQEKSKFSYFFRYTLNNLLPGKIDSLINKTFLVDKSLDDVSDDGTLFIEGLEDPSGLSLGDEIRLNNFKYEIASPSRETSRKNALVVKILKMQALGMSLAEIARALNITIGKARYLVSDVEKELDNFNFKIDIK